MNQRNEEWYDDRAGKATASEFCSIMPGKKGAYLKAREDYMAELVTERLTGAPLASFGSKATDYGTDTEGFARNAYEMDRGILCVVPKFMDHQTVQWCGASPDGLIGDDGGIEIKCPANSSIHLKTVLADAMPEEHIPQVQGQMWVTGRQWVDFISFDPRMPPKLQLFIKRIPRDEEYIAKLAAEVTKFLSEVDAMTKQLMEKAA